MAPWKRKEEVSLSSDKNDNPSAKAPTPTTTGEELPERLAPQEEQEDGKAGWRHLFLFMKPSHYPILVVAIIFSAAAGAVTPVATIFLGRIFQGYASFGVGQITGSQLLAQTRKNAAIYAGLASCSWVFNAINFAAWIILGELQGNSARTELFEALLKKSMAWHDVQKVGITARLPRLHADIRNLQMATAQPFGAVVEKVMTALVALGVAFYHSWSVPLVTFSSLPIAVIVLVIITSRMQPAVEAQNKELLKAVESAHNALSAIETVKCFNGQGVELSRFLEYVRKAAGYYFVQARSNAAQMAFLGFFTQSMFVQGFWFGCHLANTHQKSTADIITTFWSCITATQALQGVVPYLLIEEKGKAAGLLLKQLIDEEDIVNLSDGQELVVPAECRGHVVFENVSFAYPSRPDQTVLKQFNSSFEAGEITFVVGASGSGKSTLAQLLLRFYEPSSGNMYIDGTSVRHLDPHWIRKNVTLVEQQSILFPGSFLDNIALGRPDEENVTVDDISESAQFALLRETIDDFSAGFHADLGRGGSLLSGGQRQRVALARAYLRDTPILMLDESTSALDHITRGLLITAVRQWRKGRTTIVITHDLAQVEVDDFVYVLANGELIAKGTRRELQDRPDLEHFTNPAQSPTTTMDHPQSPPQANIIGQHQGRPESKVIEKRLSMLNNARASRPLSMMMPSIFSGQGTHMSMLGPSVGLSSLSGIGPGYNPTSTTSATQHHEPTSKIHKRKSFLPAWPIPHEDVARPPTPPSSMPTYDEATMKLIENSAMTAVGNRIATTQPGPRKNLAQRLSRLSQAPDAAADEEHASEPPTPPFPRTLTAILGTIWPTLTRRQRVLLVLGFACATVHSAGNPSFAYIFSKLLTTLVSKGNQSHTQLKWSLGILGLAFADGCSLFSMHFLLEYCGQAWVDSIRGTAMSRLLAQPRAYFSHPDSAPELLCQRLDRNAEEMRNLLGRFSAMVFVSVLMILLAVLWSVASCWKLTLVGLAMVPVALAVTRTFQHVNSAMEERSNAAGDAASLAINECFAGLKAVHALTLERRFRARHDAAAHEVLRVGVRRALSSGFFWGASESIVLFTNVLLLSYAATLVAHHAFPLKHVMVVLAQLTFGVAALSTVSNLIPQINSSRDTALQLIDLSHLPATSHESTGTSTPASLTSITLSSLTFAYPSRPTDRVLTSLSLNLHPTRSLALVGPSGSGKSTIASLLLRLYPATPTTALLANTHPLSTISTTHLRTLIALVPQTPVLFPATVLANLTYGLPLDSPLTALASVRAAARAAGIDDFVASLPDGYSTRLGDAGTGLSGGQAQRLAIARAMLRRPQVLVLDECTAALDFASARAVRETLGRWLRGEDGLGGGAARAGRMCVVITHDREMMEMCDEVCMLEEGRVVERGAFGELVGRRGRFARLLAGGVWEG